MIRLRREHRPPHHQCGLAVNPRLTRLSDQLEATKADKTHRLTTPLVSDSLTAMGTGQCWNISGKREILEIDAYHRVLPSNGMLLLALQY